MHLGPRGPTVLNCCRRLSIRCLPVRVRFELLNSFMFVLQVVIDDDDDDGFSSKSRYDNQAQKKRMNMHTLGTEWRGNRHTCVAAPDRTNRVRVLRVSGRIRAKGEDTQSFDRHFVVYKGN